MTRYGLQFNEGTSELEVELTLIRYGGAFQGRGLGLFDHMMNARKLLWPDRYRHEWTDLIYKEIIAHDVIVLVGPASSGKTSTASEYALIRYLSSPCDTLVFLSTTEVQKLETGIFGEVKMLWSQARDLWGDKEISGHLIDHIHCIATDNLAEGEVRDLRRGIRGIACFEGRQWVGMAKILGTKQRNIIFIGDELQAMAPTFIESWDNLFSNPNVKIVGSGNPWHNPDDQLGLAAEPIDGWTSIGEPKVTTCWDTKFMGGRCVNLVGTDSPNFHAAAKGLPEPYPGLIGPAFAARTAHNKGINSPKYYEQVLGVMKLGMITDRVITRQLCREHHAHDSAVWGPQPRVKVHGLDPSYGGKDDCVSVILEFGKDPEGLAQLAVLLVKEHRFDLSKDREVEAQLAEQVYQLLGEYQIPVTNSYYDPYGKGTMGFAFATRFGHVCPIPIDSGARASERPVRQDLFVTEKNGHRRLQKCSEHYSKFVTEAWFSVRYVIEANQMKDFPESVMKEMCSRTYRPVTGDRLELEPKDDYKERTGRSPNEGDAMAIALEGARRLGFQIGKLGNAELDDDAKDPLRWLNDMVKKHSELEESKRLSYASL